jgi:hypothetical protein
MQNSSTLFQGTPEGLVDLLMNAIRQELKDLKDEAPSPADELFTKKQACEFLKVTATTLWRWQKLGKLETYGIGKIRYYKKADLLNLLIKKN